MKLKNAITLSAIALATMFGTTDLYAQQKKGKKCKKTEQSCQKPNYGTPSEVKANEGAFKIKPLAYDYDAVSNYIDAETMYIHFSKHYVGYLNNLNKAVEGKPEAQEFQWGTTGSMMQQTPDGPKNVIPALRYDNPNSRGMNFIKFDGIEVRDGKTYLIDAKRNIPHWNKSAMKNLTKTFDRINEAKNQNPEIKVIYEFPKEETKTKFTDWLDRNSGYQNIIDEIRVRPEK